MKKEDLLNKFYTVRDFVSRYAIVLFVVVFVAIAGYLTLQIAVLAGAEPSEVQRDQRREELKKVRLDRDAIAKLESLQDQNVSVESLFDNGRDNPFE